MEKGPSDDRRDVPSPQLSGKENSLRFHRSSAGVSDREGPRDIVEIQKSKIAECVESELGKEFSSSKFEPLTRALKILGSINAEQEIEELRRAWWEVDGLVNGVVEVHHVGFNASLQDYSKISKLLKESQHALHIVRRNLMVAQDDISIDKDALLDAYNKYAVILELTKLMKDIEWVCDAMEDLEALKKHQDWNGCIRILIQASNTLAREEIVVIPAVKGLIKQVQNTAATLMESIVAEAEEQAFHGKPDLGDQRGKTWSLSHTHAMNRRRKSRISRFGSGLFGSQGSPVKFAQLLERDGKHARSLSALGTMNGPIMDGHMVNANFGASASLVSCIARLGGVTKALSSIRMSARQKLRDSMGRCLHSIGNGQTFFGLDDSNKAEYIVKALLKKTDGIFKSVCAYIRQLALSRITAPSSGLSLLHGGLGNDVTHFQDDESGITIAVRECTALWESMQGELLHVLAAALGLRIQPNADFDSDGTFSGMYWNNSPLKTLHDEGSVDSIKRTGSVEHQKGMKFSIDEQLGATNLLTLAKTEGFSSINLQHLIKKTIGEQLCVIQSAPSLYVPVKQFVSRCCKYLDDMDTDTQKISKSANRLSPVTERILNTLSLNRFGEAHSTKEKIGKREMLLTYIVDVLRTDFVPCVYAECGHKTQSLIASMTMSLQSFTGTYRIAENTVELVRDALKWASMAAVVAPNITGVLENSLGKIVESLQSQIHSIAADSLGLKMAQDTNLTHLMAQEPIAGMLGGPEWFASISSTVMDSFLSSAIVSGFAQGKEIFSKETLKFFMDARPIEKGGLILQSNSAMRSIISIAFIGQTAELISDGIYKIVDTFSSSLSKDSRNVEEVPDSSMDRGLTAGLANIANQYRSISGLCTRILRIEATLHVLYAMQEIVDVSTPSSIFESRIAQMAPKLASMDEVLVNHLPAARREYIFAPLSGFCMKAAIYLHKDIPKVDAQIISSVNRSLSGIQAVLGTLGLGQQRQYSTAMSQIAGTQPLEQAKTFYTLSNERFETIYDAASDRNLRDAFEYKDWIYLVNLVDPKCSQDMLAKFNKLFSS